MQLIKDFLKGAVIGVANIIPGVSGGTMALVLGIYERLISAIHNISLETVKHGLGIVRLNSKARDAFLGEMKRIDAWWLCAIAAGALTAIVALANVMTYLLENHHDPTYGFFLGLVAVSALVPFKLIRKHSLIGIVIGVLAFGGVVALSNTMGGKALLEKEQKKYELKLAKENQGESSAATQPEEKRSVVKLIVMFLSGAVAISAMILPGISGSFLLLLMGAYFEILKAITYRDFILLFAFAAGCGIGILAFTRFLNYLLKRWHDYTMTFLLGLVIGSLWAIWPFRDSARVGDETIYLANQFPAHWGPNEWMTLLMFLAGSAVVAGFIWFEQKQTMKK